MPINLKQALEQNKLPQFLKEHKNLAGDAEAFRRAVEAMARKSPEAPETSPPDDTDD